MAFGIIFDLDGTLLNSLTDLQISANYMLAQYGLPPRSLEEIRSFVGTGARNLVKKSLPGLPIDPPVDEALEVYREHYASHSCDNTAPYEGVAEALSEIAARYPVAIVSNKPDGAVKDLCKKYFPGISAWGEMESVPRKPAPDMLYMAMRELGVAQCIYVGDSETDVETAANTGIPCLSVLWGFRDKDCLLAAGAKYFCDTPALMLQALEEMVNEEFYGK